MNMKNIVKVNDKVFKNQMYPFLEQNFGYGQPFLLKELYELLPNANKNTIREYIRRLINENKLISVKNGVYELPNSKRLLKKATPNISGIIEISYLKDRDNNIFGYKSGINLANKIGLTTQTAAIDVIYSNRVSNRKREIKINNTKLIINSPRVKITNENYKLLQILDLLLEFEKYSEYDLNDAKEALNSYISNIKISEKEFEKVISSYPQRAQIKFYKIWGNNILKLK